MTTKVIIILGAILSRTCPIPLSSFLEREVWQDSEALVDMTPEEKAVLLPREDKLSVVIGQLLSKMTPSSPHLLVVTPLYKSLPLSVGWIQGLASKK